MYVTTINIPIVFDADSDQEARERLELLLEHFAQDVTLGTLRDELGAEISDAPTADGLQESLRYQPLRTVSTDDTDDAPVGQWAYVCSGRGPATQVDCDFRTNSIDAANRHFERFNHDVDSTTGEY